MYVKEVFAGRYQAAPNVTEFPNITSQSDLILVGPITIRSACSHHFCPIIGKVQTSLGSFGFVRPLTGRRNGGLYG